MFFSFPEDARWNPDRQTVEFSVGIGEYEGVVRVSRHSFRRFIDGAATPDRCIESYYLHRTDFERIAERKLRNRQPDRRRQRRDHRPRSTWRPAGNVAPSRGASLTPSTARAP